jgi:hypothetical protein
MVLESLFSLGELKLSRLSMAILNMHVHVSETPYLIKCTFIGQLSSLYDEPAYKRNYQKVVRVSGYRSRGQGSIPGVTRFSEK